MINEMIILLKRIKKCEKSLFLFIDISENLLFTPECLSNLPETERRYAQHIHESMLKCIKLIEDDRDPT